MCVRCNKISRVCLCVRVSSCYVCSFVLLNELVYTRFCVLSVFRSVFVFNLKWKQKWTYKDSLDKLQKLIFIDNTLDLFECSVRIIIFYGGKLNKFHLGLWMRELGETTQYMINSTLVCPAKIEYVAKNNIFGLNLKVKSGLEKIFLKFLNAHTM